MAACGLRVGLRQQGMRARVGMRYAHLLYIGGLKISSPGGVVVSACEE